MTRAAEGGALPVAWAVFAEGGTRLVSIFHYRDSACSAADSASGRDEGWCIVPLYAKPPVAPSCSASFDAALAALDYQPVDVRDNGTHVYELLGLDDVRAAHAVALAARDARIATLEAALREIAYAEGTDPVDASWDEPDAAKIARAALEAKS